MSLTLIAKQQPEAVKALYRLKHEVFKDGALTAKEKALMAVSLTCFLKCEECMETWSKRAKELGATVDENQRGDVGRHVPRGAVLRHLVPKNR